MSALRQPSSSEQPLITALPQTTHDVLDAIREAYTFVDAADEAAVIGVLATRPDVAAVLIDALPHVSAIFGEGTRVLLIAIDYHTDEPLGLSALIDATGSVPEMLAKQDNFYRAWWLSVPGEIADVLSFSV